VPTLTGGHALKGDDMSNKPKTVKRKLSADVFSDLAKAREDLATAIDDALAGLESDRELQLLRRAFVAVRDLGSSDKHDAAVKALQKVYNESIDDELLPDWQTPPEVDLDNSLLQLRGAL